MRTLSEADSKRVLAGCGVAFPEERQATSVAGAVSAASDLGHPVVLKLGGDAIAHKTERGLVRVGLHDEASVAAAAAELLGAARPEDGAIHLLIAPMLRGTRELIAGLHRDAQFGMSVMLGAGGILAEATADVVFRLVPITRLDAGDMIDDLATQELLGELRGEPAVDREALIDVLVGLSTAAEADPRVVAADLNPLIVVDGRPIAVDALVELAE
ncbi:MAG: acetate--CoA ligase family protein [Acidimicrobiales bacterium]